MKKVIVTDTVFPSLALTEAILEGVATVTLAPPSDNEALLRLVEDANAIINCYKPLNAELIARARCCRIIARSGIGVDTIDIAAASKSGIMVTNVPDYCVEEVADHAAGLMLALLRGIGRGSRQTLQGGWDLQALKPVHRICGLTLGLIGFGKIGAAFAKRARVFGMKIIFFDPYFSGTVDADITHAHSLMALLEASDVVSLHAPLTSATHHMIGHAEIEAMKSGAVLINTSRGGLCDTSALLQALTEGKLAVGLDVLEEESPATATKFADFPNAIVTPHLAFYSEEAMLELQTKCSEGVKRALTGESPIYWLNRSEF